MDVHFNLFTHIQSQVTEFTGVHKTPESRIGLARIQCFHWDTQKTQNQNCDIHQSLATCCTSKSNIKQHETIICASSRDKKYAYFTICGNHLNDLLYCRNSSPQSAGFDMACTIYSIERLGMTRRVASRGHNSSISAG